MLTSVWWDAALAGSFGLLIGSFLNVVIYRLPKMLERQWLRESSGFLSDELNLLEETALPAQEARRVSAASQSLKSDLEQLPPFNLMVPRSRCQKCGHVIAWYENVPVLSFLVLRGQCSVCKTSISLRYPAIEILTAAFFAMVALHYGLTVLGLAWATFSAILIALFFIDFDTQLLPDSLTYFLLWLGLGAAASGWTIPLSSAVWGAIAGYLSLWLLFHAYRIATGKEGMGHGDFKLFAALGAWFGMHYLIAIILLASLVGSVIGLALLWVGRIASKEIPIAFGPFLAGAGLVCLAVGPGQLERLLPFAFPFSQMAP